MPKDPSKTEKATQKKRDDERKKGSVAISKEIGTVAVMISSVFVFYFAGSFMLNNTTMMMQKFFYGSGSFSVSESTIYLVFVESIIIFSKVIAPLMIVSVVIAFVANVSQIGLRISLETMSLKLSSLDPIKGAKKFLSVKQLMELPKAVIKLLIVSLIAYITIKQEYSRIFLTMSMGASELLSFIGSVSLKILIRTIWALIALAILDFIFQKYQYEENMKMTKEEVKDEMKQREGDPKVKSKIRSVQYQMARRRMMEAVPNADVVVTNPVHLAVALEYKKDKMAAPTVVAKGAGFVAEKIKEIARKNGIPVVENKPLARTLYKLVEIGENIPVSLYKAVAEVLAYVYRLKNEKFKNTGTG